MIASPTSLQVELRGRGDERISFEMRCEFNSFSGDLQIPTMGKLDVRNPSIYRIPVPTMEQEILRCKCSYHGTNLNESKQWAEFFPIAFKSLLSHAREKRR